MICSSANCRTISVIAFCSSVRSVCVVAVAMGGDFTRLRALGGMGGNFRLAKEIAQIACPQHGNITTAQLIALGFDGGRIHRWVKLGRLYRVYRGVYAVGRPPATPLEKAAAAVLACGRRSALSHSSAMTLWGLWKRWDEPFEVSVA